MQKELTEHEKIAYDCRKATLLIEKKQNIQLSPREKMELKIHLAGCSICRIYQQQSILINRMMNKLFKGKSQQVKLDSAFKETLQRTIDQKLDHRY